jgi:hypothetical protein
MVVHCSERTSFLVDSGRAGIANIGITHLPALDSENAIPFLGSPATLSSSTAWLPVGLSDLRVPIVPADAAVADEIGHHLEISQRKWCLFGFQESSFGRGDINAKPDHSHSGGRALRLDKSAIFG